MQGKKRYSINVLSYKYKRECMKLFSSPLNNNFNISKDREFTSSNINNINNINSLCPGGKNCLNYTIIIQLENQIKALKDTISQLKKINKYEDISNINNLKRIETPIKKDEKVKYDIISSHINKTNNNNSINNDLCNSFRNSMKRRNISGIKEKMSNHSMSLDSAPYKIKIYSTEPSEQKEKEPFKKILHKAKSQNNIDDNNENLKEQEQENTENTSNNNNNDNKMNYNNLFFNYRENEERRNKSSNKLFQSMKIKRRFDNERYETNSFSDSFTKSRRTYSKNENILFYRGEKSLENNTSSLNISNFNNNSRAVKIITPKALFGINSEKKSNEPIKNKDALINNNKKEGNKFIKMKINPLNSIKSNKEKYNYNKANTYGNKDYDNKNILNGFTSLLNNEFNNYIKEFENKTNNKNGNKLFNELYSLTNIKDKVLLEKIKNLSDENIYKFSSLINFSLKYLSNSITTIQKIKNFHKIMNSGNYSNINNNLDEEFLKYRDKGLLLLGCEKINIYYYDSSLDCLVLKDKDNELKFPKDKDLIGLSFTTSKKIKHDLENNLSHIPTPFASYQKSGIKIYNLLIYPLKDKCNNIYGVIEAINKIKNNSNKTNNEKANFDKNDEYVLSLLSRSIGSFCQYYHSIKKIKKYIFFQNEILKLWKKFFIKEDQDDGSIYLLIEEFSKIMKTIFESNLTQFILFLNNNLFDIQKNKLINKEGLIYKCLQDKKIIYTSNPLKNIYYNANVDLPINMNSNLNENKSEELITFPIFDLIDKKIVMIIQIKTNRKIGEENNNNFASNEKLNEESKIIIEHISFIIQKYLHVHKGLIKNYEYFTFS